MRKILNIILIVIVLAVFPTSVFAGGEVLSFPDDSVQEQAGEETMTIDLYINSSTVVRLESVPVNGYLDVYSILGVKVTGVNLKSYAGNCSIDLPKGIYILKAGKVAKKIVVR